jgi:hypothetical protein
MHSPYFNLKSTAINSYIQFFNDMFDACNETKWMHYLSSVYSVTLPLHVSGLLVDHPQEVTMCICINCYVL